jgi:hypothetical protein
MDQAVIVAGGSVILVPHRFLQVVLTGPYIQATYSLHLWTAMPQKFPNCFVLFPSVLFVAHSPPIVGHLNNA